MELFLVGLVSFLIGWNISENYTRFRLKRYVKGHMDKTANEPEYERVQIRVEKRNETLVAYRIDDGTYLAQSDSGKELVALLKQHFSGQTVNITIHKDDGADHISKYF